MAGLVLQPLCVLLSPVSYLRQSPCDLSACVDCRRPPLSRASHALPKLAEFELRRNSQLAHRHREENFQVTYSTMKCCRSNAVLQVWDS